MNNENHPKPSPSPLPPKEQETVNQASAEEETAAPAGRPAGQTQESAPAAEPPVAPAVEKSGGEAAPSAGAQEITSGPAGGEKGQLLKSPEEAGSAVSNEQPTPAGEAADPALSVMVRVLGVKFRRANKTYFFNAGNLLFSIGEQVIVETDRGLGLARVVTPVLETEAACLPRDLKRVIRKANWNDLERDRKNREREKEAFLFCQRRIRERKLAMKLVQAEYLHDASKAIFYFTAEQRVDFRELVKDLAHHLHTRIEMRQIGVRDESKLVGGLGPCGREICCASFLTDFSPVSVRMAKDQNLAMNPNKVSGVCGRLMCCLAYEHPLYQEALKKMPKKGKTFVCPDGMCRVVDLNVLTQKVLVELESGKIVNLPVSELRHPEKPGEPFLAESEEEEELGAILESDDPWVIEQLENSRRNQPPSPPSPSGPPRNEQKPGRDPSAETRPQNHHAPAGTPNRRQEGTPRNPPGIPYPPPGRPWPEKPEDQTLTPRPTASADPNRRRKKRRRHHY